MLASGPNRSPSVVEGETAGNAKGIICSHLLPSHLAWIVPSRRSRTPLAGRTAHAKTQGFVSILDCRAAWRSGRRPWVGTADGIQCLLNVAGWTVSRLAAWKASVDGWALVRRSGSR